MAYYIISNNDDSTEQNISSTYKTIVQISAITATLKRALVSDVLVGASDVPNATDCAIVYDISRNTTTTTGTAITATKLNPADAASGMTTKVNFTIEPIITATSSLLTLALNQRASQRWVAAPGSELVIPATDANGVSLRALSTNFASKVACAMIYQDM